MSKKLLTSMILGLTVAIGCAVPAMADSRRVVTLGADLTEAQQNTMLRYFGVSRDAVDIIWINNDDEREHLGSYVPLEQIGTKTFSCALVSPTRKGGIQVKTANLNWVTCNMIASTLSTSGVKNCQVVAASPFEVSGTGALTGVIMAYETAEDVVLEPVKVELANEELVKTANLSDEIGQSEAVAVINASKIEVIENDITDVTEITNIINNVSNEYNIDISEDQSAEIAELLAKIAEQDYDITQLKATLGRVQANVAGDAGASEEMQKELEESATIAEEEALEAAIEEGEDNGVVVFEDEDDEEEAVSILDFTDISALEEDGMVVFEGDTTSTVKEQEEADVEELVDEDDEDIPEAVGEEVDFADQNQRDVDVIDEEYTKDDLEFDDLEVYEDIEKGLKEAFRDDEVSNEYGETVYLTTDAVKDLQKALKDYVLKVFVKGYDEVAMEESMDPEISGNIIAETAAQAPDQLYDDPDLSQIDEFVRRVILKDSEKILKDCNLDSDEAVIVYDEVIKVLEKAFGVEKEEVIEEFEEFEEIDEDVEAFEIFDDDDEFADFDEDEEVFEE